MTHRPAPAMSAQLPDGGNFRVVFLNGFHIQALATDGADSINGGSGAGDRGDAWHAMIDCCASNGFFIEERFTAERRIDNEIDLAALDVIDNMRPALVHFVDGFDFDSGIAQNSGRAARCDNLEPNFNQISSNFGDDVFVVLVDADERHAGPWQNR